MSGRCAKCKTCPSQGGDTWCLGCSSWESIGRDLCSKWEGPPALREIANSLAVNCAREVRALRGLGAGLLASKVKEEPADQPVRAKVVPPGLAAKSKAVPEVAGEASEYSEQEEEESEEESEAQAPGIDPRPSLPRCRSNRGEPKAPEKASAGSGCAPAVADRSRATEVKVEAHRRERGDKEGRDHRQEGSRERRREKRKREDRDQKDPESGKTRRRKAHRRGGRKHQRLSRLATDPYTPHHRKLSDEFLRRREHLRGDPLPWKGHQWLRTQLRKQRGGLLKALLWAWVTRDGKPSE